MVGGILGGFFTATEAASVAVAYGLVVTVAIYRTIRLRDLIPILRQTAITSAAITILVGVAAMFSYVVVRRNIPTQVVDFLLQITQSPVGIVALIILVLLIAGMSIDRNSNLLLLGPIIIPIFTTELGYSDVQTAMIIISALGVGHLTPPFGGTLLTASLVGKMSVAEISRYAWIEEVAAYQLPILALWGAAVCIRHGSHLKVEILLDVMPRILRSLFVIAIHLLIFYFALKVYQSGHALVELGRNQLVTSQTFSLYWPRMSIVIGGALIMFQSAVMVLREVADLFGAGPTPSSDDARTT